MSKKNRRKTLKHESVVSTNTFSIDDSKVYMIASIVMFHIVPLFFVMMGENGQLLLLQLFLMTLNPLFVALTGLIYGIKKGFNAKFPLFMGIIASISVLMYYKFPDTGYMMQTTIIMTIVYLLFSYVSTAIGSFIKKLLRL